MPRCIPRVHIRRARKLSHNETRCLRRFFTPTERNQAREVSATRGTKLRQRVNCSESTPRHFNLVFASSSRDRACTHTRLRRAYICTYRCRQPQSRGRDERVRNMSIARRARRELVNLIASSILQITKTFHKRKVATRLSHALFRGEEASVSFGRLQRTLRTTTRRVMTAFHLPS